MVTRTIWITPDLLFGSSSLGLIDEPQPYLMIWLGGQNHTNTRPQPWQVRYCGNPPSGQTPQDRSVRRRTQILQHEIVFQNKTHCKRSHTAKTRSFAPCQRQLLQLSLKFPCKCWTHSFMRNCYANCIWKELVATSVTQPWQPSKRVAEACMWKLTKAWMKWSSPRAVLQSATEWSSVSNQSCNRKNHPELCLHTLSAESSSWKWLVFWVASC